MVRQPARAPFEISPEAAKRISWLRRRLLSWFARNGRSFPWREAGMTPYEVVVAEILLQRTTAAGVARAYIGFLKRYPSWIALARAPLQGLENALRPLGLWRQKALGWLWQRIRPGHVRMTAGRKTSAARSSELLAVPGRGSPS